MRLLSFAAGGRESFGLVRGEGDAAGVIDLGKLLCPGGEFTNSIAGVDDIRPDGMHFGDQGADLLATWLGPQLLDPSAPVPVPGG